MEQLTISLHHTSKYTCNQRLRRIFLARPIIGRLSRIRLCSMRTSTCPEFCRSAIAIDIRSKHDGNSLEWYEWIGQFRSAVDSQSTLLDDVKLTYLKTLVTGKAKLAIADVAYSGRMYRDALRVLEQKLGQPQTVVSAHLEKLNSVPPVKMHNSESINNFSCVILSLVGVFKSLSYEKDLKKPPSSIKLYVNRSRTRKSHGRKSHG